MNFDLPIQNNINTQFDTLIAQVQPKEEPKQITHTVVEGDNLTKIAEQYDTTWIRLWHKNTNLNNQDVLVIGEKLIIPHADEILTERPLYQVVRKNTPQPTINSSGGNLYESGQCTWYVKNRRPDIPNSWGDASSWLGNAQAQGWASGTTPVAGAIGWTNGHVVYIESVSGSTVVISDMNYDWVAYHTRTVEMPASNYIYIY